MHGGINVNNSSLRDNEGMTERATGETGIFDSVRALLGPEGD